MGMTWTGNAVVKSEGLLVQPVRRRVLEILKERGGASVTELAEELGMAPVSVRHHLDILQGQGLVVVSRVRRRRTVGRPQQVYTLTEAAIDYFPNNLRELTSEILDEMKEVATPEQVKELLRRVAQRTAEEAPPPEEGQTFEERLIQVVEFLGRKGYLPRWEKDGEGRYLLHIINCPYAGVSEEHPELCQMDELLAHILLGTTPRRLSRIAAGDLRCTYLIEPPPSSHDGGSVEQSGDQR